VVRGGRVEGKRLNGEILPERRLAARGDDTIGRVDVRAMVRTDDEAMIYYTARGVIKIPVRRPAAARGG